MSPTRSQMEQAMADQLGFPNFAVLRQEVQRSMGKGVLRQLEKQLEKYPVGPEEGQNSPDAADEPRH